MKINKNKLKPNPLNEVIYGKTEQDNQLIESIRKHGIIEPLVIKQDGTIISGHRRWQTAMNLEEITEIPYRIESFKNELDEQEALIEYNRYRVKVYSQIMNEAEKLVEIETKRAKERMSLGGQGVEMFPHLKNPKGKTRDIIGQKIGVGSGRQFDKANKIWQEAKQGNEEAKKLVNKIDKNEMSINKAYLTIKQQEKRSEIEENLTPQPLPEGHYNVIYADPPWRYDFVESENRSIENQYPSMNLEDIKNIKIPTTDNAVLFLWATAPKLPEALEVMNAWGFKYKTNAVWDKKIIGMGYWFRGQHELLLVGTKGKFSPPKVDMRESSVYSEKRTEHSKKPLYYYEFIEKSFPNCQYIEIFSRKKFSEKWSVWGNQL